MTLRVVAFGDLHFPFAHKRKVAAALSLVKRLKPDAVVQVGDAYDLFSFSRFPRSQSVITPRDEISRARADAEQFWAAARAAAGKGVECYQLLGNHDERLVKRVMASLPEFEPFLEEIHARLWKFDGVTTQLSEREELMLDGVCYMHGFRKHGDHTRHNGMSTVCGHSHLGGVVYSRLGPKTLWELNAGYLGDPNSKALSYTRQRRIQTWTHGVGVIDSDGPRFVPL